MLYGQIRPVQTKIRGGLGEGAMAKYVTLFSYTSEAWARMIQNPGDRTATVQRLAESLGGSVECLYWMLGGYDGIVVLDLPDSISVAALSVTVGSTGAFKDLQTHELLTQEQLGQALSRSKGAAQAYQPPGLQEAIDWIYGERLVQPTEAKPSSGRAHDK